MPLVEFEPTISTGERPKTYTLDRTATGTGNRNEYQEYFPGGKGGRCVGLKTLQPSRVDCLRDLGLSASWNPQGLSRPVQGLLYLYLYLHYKTINFVISSFVVCC
jgi:hypothetical protein